MAASLMNIIVGIIELIITDYGDYVDYVNSLPF